MIHHRVRDWDAAYTNSDNIAGGDAWPEVWMEPARLFRERLSAQGRADLGLSYGSHPRQRYDLFLPAGAPRGLVVSVHGGYWLELDGSCWSHMAGGAIAHGFAVAIPTYRLCPEVRVRDIVADVGAAITAAAARIDGPIHLTGHSAGGHLVSRMVCAASPLPEDVSVRVRHTVSVSGLHDLRPIMRRQMNTLLQIDEDEARAESPALLMPREGARLTCWVGGAERSEFRRQTALLANIWSGLGAETLAVEEPDRHHFNIVDGLADPLHPLTAMLLS